LRQLEITANGVRKNSPYTRTNDDVIIKDILPRNSPAHMHNLTSHSGGT